MDDAIARRLVEPSSRVDLPSSKLVLIAPAGHAEAVTIAPGFPLVDLLGSGRLAMCDPMMMPAGRYGRTALLSLGVWDSVRERVATAADVLAALAYVSRHEATLGIVFDTDARLDQGVTVVGHSRMTVINASSIRSPRLRAATIQTRPAFSSFSHLPRWSGSLRRMAMVCCPEMARKSALSCLVAHTRDTQCRPTPGPLRSAGGANLHSVIRILRGSREFVQTAAYET